jgi:hypothetical protein
LTLCVTSLALYLLIKNYLSLFIGVASPQLRCG